MSTPAPVYNKILDETPDVLEQVDACDEEEKPPEKFGLKRTIGLWSGLFVSANIIIGSGIFISPNGVLKAANGSVGMSLLIWVAGGIVAALSSLCYGELATSIPESGSNFIYFHFAFGPSIAFLVPWMQVLVPSGDTAQVVMFANYALSPFLKENCLVSPSLAVKLVAIWLQLFVLFLNSFSVRWSVRVQSIFVAFKFAAIGLIFVGAIVAQIRGSQVGIHNFENAFDETLIHGITYASMSSAFYQVMYSYDGWSVLTTITEEVKDSKTLLSSALLTLLIVTFSYLALNVAYLLVLTPEEMMQSQMVATTFASKSLGDVFWLAPLTICICSTGSAISSYLTFGRMSFVAARRGHFPQILGMLHTERETPIPGLCFNTIFVIILILIGDLTMLIEAFGFVGWTFHGMSALAVLVLRYRRPELNRPFKVWVGVPVLVILISVFFVALEIYRNFHILYIYTIAFFVLGLIVYHLVVKRKISLTAMDNATLFLQKLLSLAPAEWDKLE